MSESTDSKTKAKANASESPTAAEATPAVAEPDGTIIKADGTVKASHYEQADSTTMVTLKNDLVEEFYFPDTKRPSYRVLYTKGQVVAKGVIDAYNAATEQANKVRANDGVDPDNPAGIDSTTIASGTKVTA